MTHTGWHWLMERWDKLAKFRLEWPTLDAAFWASATRWVIVILILGWTALWLRRRRAELSAAAGHAKNIGK